MLVNHGDAVAPAGGEGQAVDSDVAGIRGEQARENAHQRGLSGAVLTEKCIDLARMDVQRHVAQDDVLAERTMDAVHDDSLGVAGALDVEGVGGAGRGYCCHHAMRPSR